MKLSIFNEANPHPKNKAEKNEQAKFVSKPYLPEIVNFSNEDDLIDIVCGHTWSPFVFSEYRHSDNFISTDLITFDIDEGMTLDEAYEQVEELNLTCLALPSTSHSEEHHKFRLIFPLSRTIFNPDEYRKTYADLAEFFNVDPACKDLARFYYGCKPEDGFFHEGDLLTPKRGDITPKKGRKTVLGLGQRVKVGETIEELVETLYGEYREEVPEQVAHWLENAHTGLEGTWHNDCNSAIFTLGLQGCDFEAVEAVFRKIAPEELDSHDEYLLTRAYEDGYNSREEEDD